MFALFLGPIAWIASAVVAVVSIAAKVVKEAIKAVTSFIINRVFGPALADDPILSRILLGHFNWKRAKEDQEKFDEEVKKAEEALGKDNDGNGIPDAYDQAVTSPFQDTQGLKYPLRMLEENDYVRYMPRIRGAKPQPVGVGAKGLVRDAWWDTQGAWARVKWNVFSRGEGRPSILYLANQMDLHLLGHVARGYRVTQ